MLVAVSTVGCTLVATVVRSMFETGMLNGCARGNKNYVMFGHNCASRVLGFDKLNFVCLFLWCGK